VKLDFVFIGEGAGAQAASRGVRDDYTPSATRSMRTAAPSKSRKSRRGIRHLSGRDAAPHRFLPQARDGRHAATLKQIEADLRDRFGKFGDEVKALLLVTEIRIRANKRVSFPSKPSLPLEVPAPQRPHDDWVQVAPGFQG